MPVRTVTHNGRTVHICVDMLVVTDGKQMFLTEPDMTVIERPRNRNYLVRKHGHVLINRLPWFKVTILDDFSWRIKQRIEFGFYKNNHENYRLRLHADEEENRDFLSTVYYLAYFMRRALRERRLAILMATHPRLGQECPLACVPDVVAMIASYI